MRVQPMNFQNDQKIQKKTYLNEPQTAFQGPIFKQQGTSVFENRYQHMKPAAVYGNTPQTFEQLKKPFQNGLQSHLQGYNSGPINSLQVATANSLSVLPMNNVSIINQGSSQQNNGNNIPINHVGVGSGRKQRDQNQFLPISIVSTKRVSLQPIGVNANLIFMKNKQSSTQQQLSEKKHQEQMYQASNSGYTSYSPQKTQSYNDFDIREENEGAYQKIKQSEVRSPHAQNKIKQIDDAQEPCSPNSIMQKPFLSPQKFRSSDQQQQEVGFLQKQLAQRSSSAVKKKGNKSMKDESQALMILQVKEKCTFKKYSDPVRIQQEKSMYSQDATSLRQAIRFQSTSNTYDNHKVQNIRMASSRNFVEGEGDDDSDDPNNENDQSLDLDDDEDDQLKKNLTKSGIQANTQPQQDAPKVLMLKSIYPGRPATIFFPYHKSCQQAKPRDVSRTVACTDFELKKFDLKYKIKGDNPYKCVVKAFEEAGFVATDEGDWNAMWSLPKKDKVKSMNAFQKYNHFPGCWNLGRKDFMWRCLNKLRRKFPQEMEFVPNTYLLCNQGDWDRFLVKREEAGKNQLWISKPADQACGRGVKVISKTSKIKRKQNNIICDYISHPHLINGFKYDLRLYVLVSSYDPLRIYLYEDGLTRFATETYTTSTKEVSKRYIHLTNYSVNKHAKKFVKNTNSEVDGEGSKWSLIALKNKYQQMGIDVTQLFNKIKDVIIKTCISAESQMLDLTAKASEHRQNCYELYGFDVLVDSKLKPWILEVNVCPSLSSSSPLDRKIKHSLLVDTLNLVGVLPYDKKQFEGDKKNGNEQMNRRSLMSDSKKSVLSENKKSTAENSVASSIYPNLNNNSNSTNSSQVHAQKKSGIQFHRSQTMIESSDFEKLTKLTGQVKKNFSKNLNDIQDLCADNCLDKLSPENWEVLFETDEENHRRGHFERIFPPAQKEKREYYSQFFDYQRFNNIIIDKWMSSSQNFLEKIIKKKYNNNV